VFRGAVRTLRDMFGSKIHRSGTKLRGEPGYGTTARFETGERGRATSIHKETIYVY